MATQRLVEQWGCDCPEPLNSAVPELGVDEQVGKAVRSGDGGRMQLLQHRILKLLSVLHLVSGSIPGL